MCAELAHQCTFLRINEHGQQSVAAPAHHVSRETLRTATVCLRRNDLLILDRSSMKRLLTAGVVNL